MSPDPTSDNKFRVVVLTHGGAELFLEKLEQVNDIEVVGVFVETKTEKHRPPFEKLKRSVRYDGWAATLTKFVSKSVGSSAQNGDASGVGVTNRDRLSKFLSLKGIPMSMVDDYHSESSLRLLRDMDADLGVLYGTNIVREQVFSVPRLGSINIHQGLAPLYRGGPTVFWELFNGETEVGITVHWVAAKVDTGDIILQKRVPLEYDFARYGLDFQTFMDDFRASLVEPASQLLADAVQMIAVGNAPRTPQDISIGKRYKLPIKSEKDALLRILNKRHKVRRS